MHDILVIQTKQGWCLESLTVGSVSFIILLSIKTMGTNDKGIGSHKNMTVHFAS